MQQINRKQFITALQRVSPAIPNNNVLPITENVHIKNNVMTATNTNLSVQCRVQYTGEVIIPHKLLLGLLSATEDEFCNIYELDNNIFIEVQGTKHKLGKAQDISHFPLPVIPENLQNFNAGENFFTSIESAVKCQSENETYRTHGVLVGEYIVGSNNTVIYTSKSNLNCALHVSPLFVRACAGLKGATIQYNEKFISAENDEVKIICKLIDQAYVNINVVVEMGASADYNVVVDRDAFLNKLNTIEIYGHPIRVAHIILSSNNLHLHYYNIDFEQGSDFDIPCVTDLEMEVHISVPEFIRILSIQPEGAINMRFAGNQAIVIHPENNKNILSFIMPCL